MGQGARAARGFDMKSEDLHGDGGAASSERRTASGEQRIELPRSSVQLAGTDIHATRPGDRVVLPVDALESRDEHPRSMAVKLRPAPLPAFDVAPASSSPEKTTRSALREARNAALLFALLTLITSTAAVLIAAGLFR